MSIRCNGKCNAIRIKRPAPRPFYTHRHCRICDMWIKIGKGWGRNGSRCVCCHGIMAYLPRLNQNKRKYREVMIINES